MHDWRLEIERDFTSYVADEDQRRSGSSTGVTRMTVLAVILLQVLQLDTDTIHPILVYIHQGRILCIKPRE